MEDVEALTPEAFAEAMRLAEQLCRENPAAFDAVVADSLDDVEAMTPEQEAEMAAQIRPLALQWHAERQATR